MRTRDEILDLDLYGDPVARVQLEVLLDIREMLENIGRGPIPVKVVNDGYEESIPTYRP